MRARLLGGLGALLTLGAAAVVVSPSLADSASGVVAVLESRDPKRLLLALGLVVGAYAAWSARTGSGERLPADGPAARFVTDRDLPEGVSATDRTRTGEGFDASVAAACEGDDDALRAIRSNLAETAASAYARTADREPRAARRAIETGAWTDDPVAAAFLADDAGPNFSVLARLRAWLDPSAERRRRVERTVETVEQVFERDASGDAGHEDASDEATTGEEADR